MSDERLKEIKDSIGLQASVMQIKHLDTTIIDEELELYNEVIRLREELNGKQLQEMHKINNYDYFKEMTENWNREDFSRRCYDLCNEEVELQKRIDEAIKEINYWGVDKEHNDNKAMRCALINILDLLNGDKDL